MSSTVGEPIPVDFYVNLGKSGLKVSKVILGCMGFGVKDWYGDWVIDDEAEVFKVLKAAYDAGIRTYDTADIYSRGASEIFLGKFLKHYKIPRDTVVIFSKCYGPVGKAGFEVEKGDHTWVNRMGLSRKHIMDAAELTVERLGTYMDLYQIHRYDPSVPDEEVMRAMNDVVESGKTRYIGASSMYAYQFVGLQNVAEKNGWHKFISMQNYHNLLYREEEREMIPYCKQTGVGIIPWSPIAGGVLAHNKASQYLTSRSQVFTAMVEIFGKGPNADILDRVEELAKKKGVSMAVIAIAWSCHKGLLPIVGASKVERLYDAIKASKLEFTDDEIKYLEELYTPVPVFGHK